MVGQGGRPGAAPLGLPGGDRPSRQGDRDGGQGGRDGAAGDRRLGRSEPATDAVARRLRQRALRRARLSARRKRRKPSPEPASRRLATRTRPNDWRPTTACGSAATCEASCHRCGRTRRPSSATSRRDPIRPRPASPIAPPGSLAGSPASIARRGITWNARSPCSNPAATTIWPFASDMDPGVAAMAYLAIALWPLGEVDRAISLIDRMQTRIAGLTHVGTLAFGRMHAAMFELMRGDHARAAPNAFELARLAREHDLPMWRAFGVFLEGWATAASGAPGGGLEDMRRGVELLREQNVLLFDGLLKIALAEAEARAGDPDRAVAILDEALATCDRTGLSRVRSRTASGARRNPAQARPRQPRACGRSLPDRHRRREAARHAQLRTARGAVARQALPIDRPPRRSPRRPRARARRLFADAGNAGDRRGAGAARGAGGDG